MPKPDRYDLEALAAKPGDYYRVPSGALYPDDLVWSWTTHEWLRADSEEWSFSAVEDAAEAVCVIRRPHRSIAAPGQSVRTYQLKKPPEDPAAKEGEQVGLFG